jgi:prepilin-type N-terminal cleavage/methylation domain-containing protein
MESAKSGFSLIEVLIFVTILGLFFVAALSITTFSLKNMKISEHKILAAHYAEEGIEWTKSQKDDDWEAFILRDTSAGSGTLYCINSLSWDTGSCGYNLGSSPFFKREITVANSGSPTSQVEIKVTVSWVENNQTMNVTVKTVQNLWE